MIREHESFLRATHVALDAMLLAATFRVVHLVQDHVRTTWLGVEPLLPFEAYRWVLIAAVVTWVGVLRVAGGYHSYRSCGTAALVGLLLRSGLAVAALLALVLFLVKDHRVSRALLVGYVPISVGVLLVQRVVVKHLLEWLRRNDYNQRYVLFVGAGRSAAALARTIDAHPGLGLKVIGCLTDGASGEPEGDRPLEVLGRLEDLERVLERRPVDEVAVLLGDVPTARLSEWLAICAREGVRSRLFFLPPELGRVESYIETVDGLPSIAFGMPPSRSWQLGVKRLLDVVVAGTLLVVTAPLTLAVGVAIRLTSPGPIFFRQRRYGLHKRPFVLLKFRTMVDGAEAQRAALADRNEMDGPVFKMRNDPRVTPLGRLLRATSVDELPQLVNVLLGHMSLVGPRPPIPSEVEQYEPWHRRRLSMKPGLTGPWQVNGRNRVGFDQWMSMDVDYIDNWTLARDLEILLKTLPAILRGHGAW